MSKFFYSPSPKVLGVASEIAFYPISAAPSLHQLAELAGRLWPGVPLARIRLSAGINCFYVTVGEAAIEPVVCDPASGAAIA